MMTLVVSASSRRARRRTCSHQKGTKILRYAVFTLRAVSVALKAEAARETAVAMAAR